MIALVARKITRNPGLMLSLAAGVLLASAISSGIPQYTEGVLEDLLHRRLTDEESSRDGYPGSIVARGTLWAHGERGETVADLPALHVGVRSAMEYGLPVRFRSRRLSVGPFFARAEDGESAAAPGTMLTLQLIEGMESHIRRAGREAAGSSRLAAATGAFDAPLGVLLAEEASSALDLRLGGRYLLVGAQGPLAGELWVRVDGTFVPDDPLSQFWEERYATPRTTLYADGAALEDAGVVALGFPRLEAEWLCAVEHAALTVRGLRGELRLLGERERALAALGVSSTTPLQPILRGFGELERAIRLTLLFLQVPLWLLILLFVADASAVLVRHDQAEIAVLSGRGASGGQIFGVYAAIAVILAVIGLCGGPPLGLLIGRLLGPTAGFLSFLRRPAFPVGLTLRSYVASAAAVVVFALAVLAPAVSASRVSIVERRRSRARSRLRSPWRRWFVAVGLLAASGYGLYSGIARGRILDLTGAASETLPLDPLLFAASVLFLLGSSLLATRLFPLAVAAVRLAVGSRSIVLHGALLHLARDPGDRDAAVLFLVFTVGVGVFGASTARTMNRHFEDTVRQRIGAEVTMTPLRGGVAPATPMAAPGGIDGEQGVQASGGLPASTGQFARAAQVQSAIAAAAGDAETRGAGARTAGEDLVEWCRTLPGVALATELLRVESMSVMDAGGASVDSGLTAVTPAEFGRIAWWRPDLYPAGFAKLLNALASRPDALLVSTSLAEALDVRRGDYLGLSWGGRWGMRGVVVGVFDYWPGHAVRTSPPRGKLVVANLPYVDAMTGTTSERDLWIRRDRSVRRTDFYAALRGSGLTLVGLQDADGEVARTREQPFVRGINGVLTIGFLASVAVCLAGLVMHAVAGLQGRVVELGFRRAAGLSRACVAATVAAEQCILVVASVAAGTGLGGVAGQLFIPLLQAVPGVADRTIPFVVGASRQDYRNVMLFAAAVLLGEMVALGAYLRRFRVAEALKLGEE